MSDKLRHLHADISEKLSEINSLFTKDVKMTLIIRTPWLEDGGVLMGNDDFEEAISELNRLRKKEPIAAGQASQKENVGK